MVKTAYKHISYNTRLDAKLARLNLEAYIYKFNRQIDLIRISHLIVTNKRFLGDKKFYRTQRELLYK